MWYDRGMIKVLMNPDYLPAVVKEVRDAQKSIWVAMFEWSWYPGQHTGTVQDLNRELAIRGRAGLDIRVMLHNEAIGRHLHRINRKTASHLTQNKVKVKWGNSGKPLHAKVWIFDQERVIIGSHNISVRSTRTNIEVSVLCDVREVTEGLAVWFEAMWDKMK